MQSDQGRATGFFLGLTATWDVEPSQRDAFHELLRAMVAHSRSVDAYEPIGSPRSLGDGHGVHLRVIWHRYEWTLSDFMALLVAHHRRNSSESNPDAYMVALSRYDLATRDELARFAFFLALSRDTRAMRVVCKQSNVIEELGLDCPRPQEILNLRRILPDIIDRYTESNERAHTKWDWAQCRVAIIQALATGTLMTTRSTEGAPRKSLVTSVGSSPWEQRYLVVDG